MISPCIGQELAERRQATERELVELQEAIVVSEEKRLALTEQINALDKDRETINRSLIETTKKARSLEKRVSKAGSRLAQLRDEEADIRFSLQGKHSVLAEVLGALQRMGRKPPPALLISPQDALLSVRSAILLGSVIPEMRAETDILIGQLRDLGRVSEQIEKQRSDLSSDLALLAQEEERLSLLLSEKQLLAGRAVNELAQESARSAALAAQATSLRELISSLETEIESAREAAAAAQRADEEREAREAARIAAAEQFDEDSVFADVAREAPAISFAKAKGLLPLPVAGEVVSLFGEDNGAGDPFAGINLQTLQNARVISPTDGWIVYAGPFRSYGQLLIINAGQGYHVVLAGLDEINVQPGQFVIVGEPLGRMGSTRLASIGEVDVSTTTPILYVEFRKDDKSIDPAPWWAEAQMKRDENDS